MDNWDDVLRAGLADVIEFIPKLLLAAVILIAGLLLAKLISKGLDALLTRVGFDRLIERGGIKRALANSNLDASEILASIVYWTLVLFVLQFAFGIFGPNPVSDLLEGIIAFLPNIIVAIIIIIIAAAIAAGAKKLIENTLGGLSYGPLLANIAAFFILFLGVVAALGQVNVAESVTTPLLIALLAIVAGVVIVGAGGGLIRPMQARWEAYLARAEAEVPRIRAEAAGEPTVSEQVDAATQKLPRATRVPRARPVNPEL